ncbi:AGE family epimerase/isomerase [Tabrizicola sp. J26]|uniref:AGE family epimerase/isomerase n=1 Tax=Alitabrizicola rongguiensis TaxID=2909234 RepID=UPI001F1E0807|nr:AGE family epimerase/isomerase [Tabrizicola rongguiensis]MCF1709215.1 AGE family epimerase/isomerase [Tabrizicola rongguiensis]
MQDRYDWPGATGPDFLSRPIHRQWLLDQAKSLFAFFHPAALNPKGGFHPLDDAGRPFAAPGPNGAARHLHEATRMVHCYAMAHQLGLPGADRMIDHGMDFIWTRHRDQKNGGYFWGIDDSGPVNPTKQAYGHAFVLLAGSSAKVVGHPDADQMISDVTEILLHHFWDNAAGATTEEYAADWQPLGSYRGQNSNMHLTEALMAAFEATGDRSYLVMAERIASLIINCHARAEGWRVAEHFHADWTVDRDYAGDPMFRPAGTTPGHALEWSRLLVQLWELGGRQHAWMHEAAQALFLKTCAIGWDRAQGGFYYTLDWQDRPDRSDRYWWPCAEGIAAASVLRQVSDDPRFELWYRRIWSFVATHVIDHQGGSWWPEIDDDLKPVSRVFTGKPDLYHAVQACLIPLLPSSGSATRGLASKAGAVIVTG